MGAPMGNRNAAGPHNMGAKAAKRKMAKYHKKRISAMRRRTIKTYNRIRKKGGW